MNIDYVIKNYSKLIYKICYNILSNNLDAQDITQEVYIVIYKNIDKYSSIPENEFKNIICTIALNKCKDFLKSKVNKLSVDYESEDKILNYIDNTDIEESIFEKDKNMNIHKMVNELKPPYNEILYEYYINEMSLDDLSNKLHIPKQTLKVQIYRGKQLLKENLKKEGENLYG